MTFIYLFIYIYIYIYIRLWYLRPLFKAYHVLPRISRLMSFVCGLILFIYLCGEDNGNAEAGYAFIKLMTDLLL